MNWDQYYLNVCNAVSENSKCLSRKIGAIIVKDKSIISTGYNGPPRGVRHCYERYANGLDIGLCREMDNSGITIDLEKKMCPRYALQYKSGQGLHLCIAGHAERNSLINAARNGIAVKGATMYMNCPIPCKDCLIEIINAGIEEVVITGTLKDYYDEISQYLLKESNLKIRLYNLEE